MNFLRKLQGLPRTKSMQEIGSEPPQNQKQKSYLDLVRGLPERGKKIILWAVIIVIGILFLTFYIKDFRQRFKNFNIEELKKEFKIPELQEGLKEMPKFQMPNLEMPKISDEELKNLEDEIQKNTASGQ